MGGRQSVRGVIGHGSIFRDSPMRLSAKCFKRIQMEKLRSESYFLAPKTPESIFSAQKTKKKFQKKSKRVPTPFGPKIQIFVLPVTFFLKKQFAYIKKQICRAKN